MMMYFYIGLLCLISSTSAKALSETTLILTSYNSTAAQSSCPRCLVRDPCQLATLRDDYRYIAGIAAYKVHTRAVTWNEARHTCEEEGGHLAIINSVAEANAIVAIIKKSGPITGATYHAHVLLGFHDLYKEGEFVTIHGQSLARAGYNRWNTGEPNNDGGAGNCGSVEIGTGELNDLDCQKPYGFICELPV